MPLSNKGWDETLACSRDLRPQSGCRLVVTEARAYARGDPRMASDESEGKAGKSADEVRDEFEEKMDRLRRQYERDLHSFRYEIEEREYRLKAYEDKFNKIKQPPLLYAYVVRKEGPDLDGNQVVVARATELLKVSTGLVDKSQLGVGQYVWVHPQTYAIVEGSAVRNEGVIAKVGVMEAIERIKDVVVLPYQEAKLFQQIALEAPRGILLYGPPGCGKTLLVKAIATENDMTFFNVSIADVLSKWVGESERIIKEIFRQAHEKKPSIVFFDEIEALFTVRGMMDTSGVHKNIIAQILSEMDGLVELHDVFVIGATNRADLVDPALLRPGRFDEIIETIVTTAKKNFVKRVIQLKKTERKKEGLTMKDLEMAIDEESKEHAITEMYVYEKRQREVFRTGADPMVG